jgi:hypothetical protein
MNKAHLIWHNSRDTYMSKHHLVPKSLGGCKKEYNLLRLWRDKHDSFHKIFENETLSQILETLLHGRKNIGKYVGTKHWSLLFGNRTLIEAYLLLKRVHELKQYRKNKATSD